MHISLLMQFRKLRKRHPFKLTRRQYPYVVLMLVRHLKCIVIICLSVTLYLDNNELRNTIFNRNMSIVEGLHVDSDEA